MKAIAGHQPAHNLDVRVHEVARLFDGSVPVPETRTWTETSRHTFVFLGLRAASTLEARGSLTRRQQTTPKAIECGGRAQLARIELVVGHVPAALSAGPEIGGTLPRIVASCHILCDPRPTAGGMRDESVPTGLGERHLRSFECSRAASTNARTGGRRRGGHGYWRPVPARDA